jgi:hypothetical protein
MLIIFILSLFTSATLLFLVQPMFAKMVLPKLGGTPVVWITCLGVRLESKPVSYSLFLSLPGQQVSNPGI